VTDLARKAIAEFVGTFILVFFAVGVVVFGFDKGGVVGVALGFGLVLLGLAYAIGPVSGCHVNPAVTLGVYLRGGVRTPEAVVYWVAQFLGAIAGGAMLKLMTSGFAKVHDQSGALGTNDWGAAINARGAFLLEVAMTFLLVLVVLLVTGRQAAPGFAGLAIGLTLAVVHLVGVPLDGTSVNPARSLGPALFEGGTPLRHVWLFLVAPLVGALVAVLVVPLFESAAGVEFAERPGEDPTGADVPL
jgi:aquaporin Z